MENSNNGTNQMQENLHKKSHCNWNWLKKCDEYENCLFHFKFLILIPIFFSLILAFVLFILGGWEFFKLFFTLFTGHILQEKIDTEVLSITDTFLFGMVMIIFALGAYNLFISKLDNVTRDYNEKNSIIPDWLQLKSFSELKELFIKVIVLILAILFLKNLIELGNNLKLEKIIYLSLYPISIFLLSWSIRLMSSNNSKED
jgi:uncharacterized membrane protein YqhA